jgi:NYN domain
MTGYATRDLHLVDVENLCDGQVTEAACAAFSAAYHSRRLVGPADLVTVGGTPASIKHTFALGPSWRRVVGRSGCTDAADLALLDAMPSSARLPTFRRLVIVSRDHIFTEAAQRAHAHGLTVAVVFITTDGLSRTLSAVADKHIHIELQLQLAA